MGWHLESLLCSEETHPRRTFPSAAGILLTLLRCRFRHAAAGLLAFPTFRRAFLHDLVMALLALLGAASARLGTGLMGILGQRARPGHEGHGQDAESLAVHGQFVGAGMML